jgi:outer membrane protein OmpA-like peptidoglycan-associated protein
MKKIICSYALLAVAALVGACGTTTKTTGMLEEARSDYNIAQKDPNVVNYAPVELRQAGLALQDANAAADNKAKVRDIDQRAYVAKQKIAQAQEAAKQRAAEATIASAAGEREQLRLAQRTSEADQARMQAQQAQARAAQLEAQLADMAAKKTDRGMVVTLGDVLFATNQARLNPEGMRTVRKLADFMQQNPQRTVLVEGFTDSTGSSAHNRQLSERRADAVRTALTGMGISADRIATQGYGELYPVAPNDTARSRRLNRRVEIVISDESGKVTPRSY